MIPFILASLIRRECLAKAVGDMIAAMGACESASKELRCALQADYCEPAYIDGQKNPRGERWISGWNLEKRGHPSCTCDSTAIPSCLTASNGRDGGIDYRCAAHSDLCQLRGGETFGFLDIPSSDGNQSCGCRAYGALHDTGKESAAQFDPSKMTKYGACHLSHSASKLVGSTLPANADPHQSFCAYSPTDCPDYHTWIEPGSVNNVLGHDCGCQDTHVGGCVSGFTGIYCAVTSDDCQGPFGTYHKPFELKLKHNHSCKLCERISLSSSSSSTSALAAQESIIAGAYADEIDETNVSVSGGTVVAVVIGVSSGLILISLFCAVIIYKKKKNKVVSSQSQVHDEERVFKTSSTAAEFRPAEQKGCSSTNCDDCSESAKCGGGSLDW